ncbi:AttT protein [Francisella halioticida]|uniref:GNAT family N-acetyltransferase n=1 Tax=Francisella halioticida TaxID=549298 RepID=A0ABM6LY34_9GAMM|nr:GNAT family N-acetyltransferase [Francisella halioticida]ASG67467.1 GNAT family N-acetyltransferase [Francisella halioticida]BCD89928.1 AttT protein [Francisella halioticida]
MFEYEVVKLSPSVEDYCMLRLKTGLSPKSVNAAEIARQNSWYGMHLKDKNKKTIGMGKIIGDGGCHFQVVDIAVLSEYQGKGLGKVIMADLIEYYTTNAPKTSYLNLIADGEAKYLYEKFGFKSTAPQSIGMYYKDSKTID